MKSLPVTLSEAAILELERIADYVSQTSGSQSIAKRYIERIKERCKAVGQAPRGGRRRDDLANGLRTVPFERSALICYLIEDDRIVITNIFHAGRDVEGFFQVRHAPEAS